MLTLLVVEMVRGMNMLNNVHVDSTFLSIPIPGFRRSEAECCLLFCLRLQILQPQKFPKGLHRWLAESTAGPQVISLQMTSIHDQNWPNMGCVFNCPQYGHPPNFSALLSPLATCLSSATVAEHHQKVSEYTSLPREAAVKQPSNQLVLIYQLDPWQ